jgi:WD40 repeat protein
MILARPLSCLAFSHDGRFLAAGEGGRQPSVLVWDVKTGMLMSELKGHSFAVNVVQFSHDSRLLASVGSEVDGRLNVWEWATGTLVASARVVSEVRGLAFSENGQVNHSVCVCFHAHALIPL